MTTLLEVAGVSKDYRGLRPLRIQKLTVAAGDRVALLGFDQVSAEVFVNLVTGAALPEAGRVTVFGRSTGEISDVADWFRVVDRFGIVSERAVLLDVLTTLQNLAMPFGLDVEPLTGDSRSRAQVLAGEVGLPSTSWEAAVGTLSTAEQMRIRVGRALALNPDVLLLEHISARLLPADVTALSATIRRISEKRGTALVAMTADVSFARAVASRVLRWEASTGRLAERRRWFGRRLG